MMETEKTDSARLALGIDLGATKIELALVDPAGRVVERARLETARDPDRALTALVDAARALIRGTRGGVGVIAAGAGIAGQVDSSAGVLRTSPNLDRWIDVPVARRLEEALDLPVAITNDLNAITLGEQSALGPGASPDPDRASDDLVVVYVGTGLGGGVISGGRLLEGAHGYGSELGHMTLIAGGRPCSCRNRGCLEAYVGGWAIAERAREAAREKPEAGEALAREAGGADRITGETVARAAAAGDRLARELIAETGRLLGAGLVSMVHIFNPRRLVLGGGVIHGLPGLIPAAAEMVRENAMAVFLEDLEISAAVLGDDAGVVGAARLARLEATERSAA